MSCYLLFTWNLTGHPVFYPTTLLYDPESLLTRAVAPEERVLLVNSPATTSGTFCVFHKAHANIWIPFIHKGVRDSLGYPNPNPFWLNNYAGLPLLPWCRHPRQSQESLWAPWAWGRSPFCLCCDHPPHISLILLTFCAPPPPFLSCSNPPGKRKWVSLWFLLCHILLLL